MFVEQRVRLPRRAWWEANAIASAVSWLRTPAGTLSLAIVAAVTCGLSLHGRALALALGLGTVLAIGLAWPWVNVRGLRGTIGFGRARVREGEPVEVRLELRNRLPWAAWGLSLRNLASMSEEGTEVEASLSHVRGRSTLTAGWSFQPGRRGVYPTSTPRIGTGFPFGIRESYRDLEATDRLIVWPRTYTVGPVPEMVSGHEGDGQSPRPRPGQTGEMMGVRPYRRGDSLRRVHWPQTARQGDLVVCELHALAVPRIQVVMDDLPATHGATGVGDGAREWAIRIAASFVEGWRAWGAEVELFIGARQVTRSGRDKLPVVLDALAMLDEDGPASRPVLDQTADGARVERSSCGMRLVITTDRRLREGVRSWGPGRALSERFVVLSADGFEGRPVLSPGDLAPRPWVWLPGPSAVASGLRGGWREGGGQ
jgi:uncharacterized protein (DUF58 family)